MSASVRTSATLPWPGSILWLNGGRRLRRAKAFSLHLHDVTDQNRDHFNPGEGGLDFEAFLSEVDAAGFTGGRVLEISPGRPEGATASDVRGRLRQVSAVRREWEARGEGR